MAAPLRPLSTGELLDKTFTLYRQNFLLFFGIAVLPQLGLFILVTLMNSFAFSGSQPQNVAAAASVGIAALITLLVYLVGAVIGAGVMQAATTFAVSSLYLEEPTGVKAAYARVKGMVGKSVHVVLEVGVRIVVGFMLFIIPGIIMLRRYSLAIPAAVLEKITTKEALKRSKHLSEGAGGRVLLVYVLMLALIWGVSFGLTWLLALLFSKEVLRQTFVAQTLQQFVSFLVGAAVGPVMTIAFALLYYDQRVRKEAFDIEHMIAALQPGTPSAAAAAVSSL